jgi:hypothetical protein
MNWGISQASEYSTHTWLTLSERNAGQKLGLLSVRVN